MAGVLGSLYRVRGRSATLPARDACDGILSARRKRTMANSLAPTLDFLRDLRANNNKPWFDANRARYTEASTAFEQLVSGILAQFDIVDDLGRVSAKDCIFRIYRD